MKDTPLFNRTRKKRIAANLSRNMVIQLGCWLGMLLATDALAASQSSRQSSNPGSPFSSGASSSYGSGGGGGLAQEWDPTNGLKPYKQNYILLYAHSSQPNNQPTSPNVLNQVLIPYSLDDKDIKFQISFKHALADYQGYGALWFGYTQLSLWQYYDTVNSRPFRESNYEPELIYSLRPSDASILNFGALHQSNGESNPRSRSWDRVYLQPGMEFPVASGRMIVELRWWARIPEDTVNDNNPDITNYSGNREFRIRYEQENGWKLNILSRTLSTQVDVAAPFSSWLFLSSEGSGEHLVDMHLQYFNGYGESMLDYNQSHVTTGIGISFPL